MKCLIRNFIICERKSLSFRYFQQVTHNKLNRSVFHKMYWKEKTKTKNQISLYYPEIFVIVLQNYCSHIFFLLLLMWLAYSPTHFAVHQIKDGFKCKPIYSYHTSRPLVLNVRLSYSGFNCFVFAFNLSWEILLLFSYLWK